MKLLDNSHPLIRCRGCGWLYVLQVGAPVLHHCTNCREPVKSMELVYGNCLWELPPNAELEEDGFSLTASAVWVEGELLPN